MRKLVCILLALMLCASFTCVAFAAEGEGDFVSSPGVTEPVDCPHHSTSLVGYQPATCTGEGYTGDHVCDECNKVIEEGEKIPKLPHDYEDGICTGCGAVQDNPKTGDQSHIGLWILVMILAAVALGGVTVVYRKKFANQ